MSDNYEVRIDLVTAWEQGFVMGCKYAPEKPVEVTGVPDWEGMHHGVVRKLDAANERVRVLDALAEESTARITDLERLASGRNAWRKRAIAAEDALDDCVERGDVWEIPQADLDKADDPLHTAVAMCIGAASMTFKTEAGNEVFDDRTAGEIVEWLVEYVRTQT